MKIQFDSGTFAAPSGPHRHPRFRALAGIVAATCGALAVLIVGFIIVAGVGPAESTWPYIALPILFVAWFSGFWWRWDSPDHRRRVDERVRRGF